MQLDLNWAKLELLPSAPYSVNSQSAQAMLGLVFARQRGVHAIANDRRQDFDAWPGELAYTSPEVPIFSESPLGGEYLLLRLGQQDILLPAAAIPQPRHIIRGDKTATMLGENLRRLLLTDADTLLIEEQAAKWLQHGLNLLRPKEIAPGRYQLDRHLHSQVLEYIDTHFDTPIALKDLAELVHMTPLRFLRSFSNTIGMTPHTYITEHRLQRARQLLRDSDLPIAAIAVDCGFAHQSHLGAALKTRLGLSPQQYRKTLLR